jgi:hypothetical protein
MALFLAAFVGFGGGGLFWAGGVQEWRAQRASSSWFAVTGRIVTIGYTTRRSRTIDVRYEYEHEGRRFRTGRVFFGGTGPGEMQAFAARYKVGDTVTVYVDPADPSHSVLERRLGSRWFLFMMLGLLFAVVGLAIVRFVWLGSKPGGEGMRGATIRMGRRRYGT